MFMMIIFRARMRRERTILKLLSNYNHDMQDGGRTTAMVH